MLRSHGGVVEHGVVSLLGDRRRDVADGPKQAAVVETVAPFERGVFDGLERSPRSPVMDHLGLVETVDGLGQSVVVAIADAADRRRTARSRTSGANLFVVLLIPAPLF